MFQLRLGIAANQIIFEAIEQGDAVQAEEMMREHSQTKLVNIRTFELKIVSLKKADFLQTDANGG